MKKLSLILIIFVLSYSPSFAQNYSSEPKLFVTELVNDAIDKLSDKSLTPAPISEPNNVAPIASKAI